MTLVRAGEISGKQAKEVLGAIEGTDRSARAVVEERGLRVVSDEASLRELCRRLVEAHPREAGLVRGGKQGVLGYFVGQVMKETGGAANPQLVSRILGELLGGG